MQTIDTTYGGRFKKFITERNCATHITTNNLTDKNSMCLKEDMGDNKDTYDFIKSNDCWNVTSDNETGFTTSISRNAYSSSVSETVYSPDDTYYELPVFQDIDNRYDYRKDFKNSRSARCCNGHARGEHVRRRARQRKETDRRDHRTARRSGVHSGL